MNEDGTRDRHESPTHRSAYAVLVHAINQSLIRDKISICLPSAGIRELPGAGEVRTPRRYVCDSKHEMMYNNKESPQSGRAARHPRAPPLAGAPLAFESIDAGVTLPLRKLIAMRSACAAFRMAVA